MADYTKQFPTRGDLAREQLRRRGVRYWLDVQQDIRERLAKLSPDQRKAFAAACAEHLMTAHEQLPQMEQKAFTQTWRPVLDAIWNDLAGETARTTVEQALRVFHESEYDHNLGQDGPDDADDDPAAASIYAAECFLSGDVDHAFWASGRVIDSAFQTASDELGLDPNDFKWDPDAEPMMALAQEAMHRAVQDALSRQLSDLELLEREALSPALLRRLRER